MTNTQFYLALGIPFFTILAVWIGGIISNRSVINDLRAEMRNAITNLRAEMNRRFDALESKLDFPPEPAKGF